MRRALANVAPTADILHHHGLWTMPGIYSARASRNTGCRLVFSPHGTLSKVALARSSWRKRAMWQLGQHAALQQAACFHATGEAEYRDIREAGFRQPVAIIPHGIDLPGEGAPTTRDDRRTLLFLGRLDPIKGLDGLLHAWRRLQGSFPDWELRIAGPGDPRYVQSLQSLAGRLELERTTFAGPVFGRAKEEAFRKADLFVLPSWVESFGIATGEALAHSVPVITTNTTPWSGLVDHGCGWWIDTGEAALAQCLRETLQLSRSDLHAMGRRGRDWMAAEFRWSRIASMMRDTYSWILGSGSPPAWVATD